MTPWVMSRKRQTVTQKTLLFRPSDKRLTAPLCTYDMDFSKKLYHDGDDYE